MIVVWGLIDGFCLPTLGKGFRKELSGMHEAEVFIKFNCANIKPHELPRCAMYITDEFVTLDDVLHHHNWKNTDSSFKDLNKKIEEIEIHKVKELVDLEYRKALDKQVKDRISIEREVRSMSKEQLLEQANLINQINNMIKGVSKK